MRSLPTQSQIDCLIADGIDPKRLPTAGPAVIVQAVVPGNVKQTARVEPAAALKQPAQRTPARSQPSAPASPTTDKSEFPLALVILVVVIVFLIATMSK